MDFNALGFNISAVAPIQKGDVVVTVELKYARRFNDYICLAVVDGKEEGEWNLILLMRPLLEEEGEERPFFYCRVGEFTTEEGLKKLIAKVK